MPLDQNNKFLIDTLESLPLLDERYEGLKLVNYNSLSDTKRGCFSVVFRAFDRINQRNVALKFYDISAARMVDVYRQNAFTREHEILQQIIGKKRCLQLESAMSIYNLQIPIGGGKFATVPCRYFAVEWIDSDIDDFFFGVGSYDPIQKLKLFNEIVLAIESLHSLDIFHRDIKADNLRAYQKSMERVVVAIDLGTAAIVTSGYLKNNYTESVGAPIYAAPEARCGLAGHRVLAPCTDKYALGCLLFELFNFDFFYRELLLRVPNYESLLLAMSSFIQGLDNEKDQILGWNKAVTKFKSSIATVEINTASTTLPMGIVYLLNELLMKLTHVDYTQRPSLQWVRRRIFSAIKVLENEKLYQKNLKEAEIRKSRRQEKAMRAQKRLKIFLEGGKNA